MSDKELIIRIYKQLLQLNKNNKTWKFRHFIKGDIGMAKKHMKKFSTSLVIGSVLVKTNLTITTQ